MLKTEEDKLIEVADAFVKKFFTSKATHGTIKKLHEELPLTKKQEFVATLGHKIGQLESSYERLEAFPLYVNSHNTALEKKGITRVVQFVYHVENYLSQVYITEQRIKALCGYLTRIAQKNKVDNEKINNLKQVQQKIFRGLESIRKVRDGHVHVKNYYDEGISNLELFDKARTIIDSKDDVRSFTLSRDFALKIERKKWKNIIKNNNKITKSFLGLLYPHIDEIQKNVYRLIK